MFTIYKPTNPITGKSYVGYTSTTTEKRFNQHVKLANKGSNFHFHRAIRKYGPDIWISEVLRTCASFKKANLIEQEMITLYNTLDCGYNMTRGGDGVVGRIVTDEQRNRSSEWHKQFRHTESSKQLMKQTFTKLRGRKVNQYKQNGDYVATHLLCAAAASSIGSPVSKGSIHQICAGTLKTNQLLIAGYQWMFYTGDTLSIAPVGSASDRRSVAASAKGRAVNQTTIDGSIVCMFNTVAEASHSTSIYKTGIWKCCRGELSSAGGYHWHYAN
jgi:group I intron endonuclease